MKILIAISVAIFFILLYSKCKSSEVISPEAFEKRKIYFGSGGGFAGTMTEYCLLENGQLFRRPNQMADWQSVDTLQKSQTKQYFAQIDNLNLYNINHDKSGNWSYFITIEEGDRQHRICWSSETPVSNNAVVSFYNILNDNVKSLPPFKANDPVR